MKLTLPQQDVYFEQLLFPHDPIYNIGAKIVINGHVSYEILNQAYISLINQHDAYRSVVVADSEAVQIEMLPAFNTPLLWKDFSGMPDADADAHAYMQDTFLKTFDFQKAELLHRFVLIKVSDTQYYLFSMYHHIITDGWGTSLMFQRLVKNYNELSTHGKIITKYPYSYKEFVRNDADYFLSDAYTQDKAYWTVKFQQLPERLFKRINEKATINKSSRKVLTIKRAVYNELAGVSKECGGSTFHAILALLYLYFGKKYRNQDFAIGLPILNREHTAFKRTVGLFMGVSLLRMQLNFDETFEDLIKNIRQQLRKDYRHQRFPLGKLIQELDLFHEKDRLFNIMLSYEKQNYAAHFEGTKTSVIPLTHQSERVALALYVREFDEAEDVKIDFDHNVNYFNASDIQQVVAHVEVLLDSIISNPRNKLSAYQYLTTEEKEKLCYGFNHTRSTYDRDATWLSLFESQVKKHGQKIALKDKKDIFTYDSLNRISARIAYKLHTHIGPHDMSPIAVLMERSAELVVVLLGILKSGRAYIPLDPSFPESRLQYIIEHSGVRCVVGDSDLRSKLPAELDFLSTHQLKASKPDAQTCTLPEVHASSMAYIIYTSGSTGKPKGVAIDHRALHNFLLSMLNQPGIKHDDTLFSVTTQSFDISILEFFAPLSAGATLWVVHRESLENPLTFVDEMNAVQPTIMQATPSFYRMLFNAGWQGNKQLKVLCGGDLLSESLAAKLLDTCQEVWNMYGPTETTIWSSCKKLAVPSEASIIGKPIYNTQFYILDDGLQLLPVGSMGSLYIGGDGLAMGYFKRDELTAQQFIKNPFNDEDRIYNTGDLGRWNTDGEIEFIGRNDYLVKIRGYRIELPEIESKLNALPSVKSSVVVVSQKQHNEEGFLMAYVQPRTGDFDDALVIQALRKELPEYMIPHIIIPLAEFPLTFNNKVDRKALAQRTVLTSSCRAFMAPSKPLEKKLVQFYQEILGLQQDISIAESFFRLGGHSLKAVKLIHRIEQELCYSVPLSVIFEYPAIATLANYLETQAEQKHNFIITEHQPMRYYPLTASQYEIWLASQHPEKSIGYNMSAAFAVQGNIDEAVLAETFMMFLAKYEVLRTNFVEVEGRPYQTVRAMEEVAFKLDEVHVTDNNREDAISEYMDQRFDLENDLLLRGGLCRPGHQLLFVFSTHHSIIDGWSLDVLINEFAKTYESLAANIPYVPDKPAVQYKDYVMWQQQDVLRKAAGNLHFWRNYLNGYEWQNLIPFDKMQDVPDRAGEVNRFCCDEALFSGLTAMANDEKVTLHTVLVSAFTILIHKMYGHHDICLGTVNSGRSIASLQSQLGLFVKTLPLRTDVPLYEKFSKVLQNAHQNLLSLDAHQDIPEAIRNLMRLEILFVLQHQSFTDETISLQEGIALQSYPVVNKYSRLPLLLIFTVKEKSLSGEIYYDARKYAHETIELIRMKYLLLLTEIIADPAVLVNAMSIALPFEKESALDISFNF